MKKQQVLIELVGLPGAGKTSLVRMLSQSGKFDEVLSIPSAKELPRRSRGGTILSYLRGSWKCGNYLGRRNVCGIYGIVIRMIRSEPHKLKIVRSLYALSRARDNLDTDMPLLLDQGLLVWLGSGTVRYRTNRFTYALFKVL